MNYSECSGGNLTGNYIVDRALKSVEESGLSHIEQ